MRPAVEGTESCKGASFASGAWSEFVASLPIVIVYRAVRELVRQRRRRRAVLGALHR